jgi:hypothetical protein
VVDRHDVLTHVDMHCYLRSYINSHIIIVICFETQASECRMALLSQVSVKVDLRVRMATSAPQLGKLIYIPFVLLHSGLVFSCPFGRIVVTVNLYHDSTAKRSRAGVFHSRVSASARSFYLPAGCQCHRLASG